MPLIADAAPSKQGKLMPGSHIPIVAPELILKARPDYVLILPWNIKEEVMRDLAAIRDWGGKFVTAIPQLEII